MPDRAEPFDALLRPMTPLAPRPEFAASLRRQLERELGMTTTDTSPEVREGALAMVHLKVADADRAMRFFGSLFGWQAERVPFENHISHYTVNNEVTVRLLDDPTSPPVVANYEVSEVAETIRRIESAGGTVIASEPQPDGGGWARGEDDQGLPFYVFRPGRYHEHASPTQAPTGEVGLVFIRADSGRAQRFYGSVFGWNVERVHPDSNYFETVPRVGVFDETAAFGTPVEPSETLYLEVEALAPAMARVEELGGHAGDATQDMGPYWTSMCTDDQGTEFGLMSLEP